MARLTIARLRELVRTLAYNISLHADDELDEDGLTVFDLEAILLSGTIVERQSDHGSGEMKYVIRGHTLTDLQAECVVKIDHSGRLLVITVYLDD
jgi:uncharacterized protein YprB with RNaseH-like and TPR domain